MPTDPHWLTWLILAGRGFGKTRTGAESIRKLVCGTTPMGRGAYGRIAIIGETAADGRDVMVEGDSGLLSVHPKAFRPTYEPSKRRLTWPNGAVATVFNATEPDQLRGPQFDAAWLDELAKWKYAQETWDQLQFGLRLGKRPIQIVTTTPRPIPVLKDIIKSPSTRVTKGSTLDNSANLAAPFLKTVMNKYAGTRLGRQELDAEMLEDLPGAMWNREMFDKFRTNNPGEFKRIVVGIDPSGTSGDEDDPSNMIGIVAGAEGVDGRFYILDDESCNKPPSGWAEVAVKLYRRRGADRIIAERNYGGAMVEHVIRTEDPLVPYKEVVASRGKVIRAEPVAALYEQGKVSHVGSFAALEDQMCLMGPDGYVGRGSPDRVDALVWVLTELAFGATAYSFEDLRKAVGK